MDPVLVPIIGASTGILIPIAVFVWLYLDEKNKRASIVEISKNLENSEQVEQLIKIFDERKKEPLDYRRSGVITLSVGIGLFLFGIFFLGQILKGVGALVATIGLGQIIAGYLYQNTSA
jgi:uncharacterized membrane protein YjjP (DUF1212 family)